MFLTSLKQTCNEYLIKFSENQSAPRLENRKTSPCSPCAPSLLHVLVSRIPGYHNLCSPDHVHVSLPLLLSIPTGLHPNNSCLLQSTPFSNSSFLLSSLENIVKGTRDPNHHIFKTTWQPPPGNSSSCFYWKLSIALKATWNSSLFISSYLFLSNT